MLNLKIITFIFLFISSATFAGVVKKVKGRQVLISISGHEDATKGQIIRLKNSDGKIVRAMVKKVGKKSLLLISQKNAGLKVGDKSVPGAAPKKEVKTLAKKEPKPAKLPKKNPKDKKWFVEPYFGKTLGSVEGNFDYISPTTATGTLTGSTSGFEFGSAGGYRMDNFLLGGKFFYQFGILGDVTLKTSTSSTEQSYSDSDYIKNGFGPMVGYTFGEHIRFWFSYLITAYDVTEDDGDKTIYSGSTLEVGGGWKLENNISFNLNIGKTSYSSEDQKPYPFRTTTSGVTTESKDYGETYFVLNISYFWAVF